MSRASLSTSLAVARGLLEAGRDVRFRVTGSSMGPAIPPGSVVTAVPVDPSVKSIGEVLVHLRDGRLWIHRLVRVVTEDGQPPRFVFQGDGQTHEDPPVDATAVLGRVVAVERSLIGRFELRAPPAIATLLRNARRLLHAAIDAR